MNDPSPYQVLDTCRRFPASQTVFERAVRDTEFSRRLRQAQPERRPTPADVALRQAAWSALPVLEGAAYGGEPQDAKPRKAHLADDWASFTGDIKETGSFLGAALVGVARVNRLWLYTHEKGEVVPHELETAVVMAVEMDRDLILTSPGSGADAATGNGYARMAFITAGMVTYIRRLGWRAMGSGNDTALSIPLAIDAGLGECGRNGLLTTEEYGSRVRICKVFTDLPLTVDHPATFGVSERCATCRRCVKACPVGAISDGDMTPEPRNVSTNPGVRKWPVDGEKCRIFWNTNGASCSNCISACSYS